MSASSGSSLSHAPRTTRSNTIFNPWDIFHVDPAFDLAAKVKERLGTIHAAELSENPEDGDSDLTPLPSPTGSPMTSPPSSPTRLPCTPPSPSKHTLPKDPPKNDIERRKRRRQATRTLSRNRKREEAAASFTVDRMRKKIATRYLQPTKEERCNFNIEEVEVTPRAFVGKRDWSFEERAYSIDELTGPTSWANFRLLPWDGVKPTALVDSGNRVIGLLAGIPTDHDWDDVVREFDESLEYWRSRCTFKQKKGGQRSRGEFGTLACGVSYGGGQREPTNVKNGKRNQTILNHLSQLDCFKRISGFSTSVLATRAPKLYQYYVDHMAPLYEHHPNLIRPFPGSVFAATTYNMGPQTVCYPHIDQNNLTYGTCTITPSGKYNSKKGGHLILWDLALVIEFPPGSTILIPSGILSHSNTSIRPNETRYSFTQYTAGGLFRWVNNGFMNADKRRKMMTADEVLAAEEQDERRWKEGVALFPLMKELSSPVYKSKS